MYHSVTLFRVKAWWALPLFWWHAARSHHQANASKGLVKMQVWPRGSYDFFTLTSWSDKEAMLNFRNRKKHRHAMLISRHLGRGWVAGWEAEEIPEQSTAVQKLKEKHALVY